MTNISNWNVNTLRFTTFPQPDFEIDKAWWEIVVGEAPETSISQGKTGILQIEGDFGNGRLILIINQAQSRIDWIYTPPNIPEASSQIPTIGELSQELNLFREALLKWLKVKTKPNFIRIALGLVLYQPVSDRRMGYEILASQYLNFNPNFGENASDFGYQINRKRVSKAGKDLEINRLMKWSVSGSQMVIVSPIQQTLPESFAILLELDINSSSEYKGLVNAKLAKNLLDEFAELAQEITQKGDIA